jgi:hypothetical protein
MDHLMKLAEAFRNIAEGCSDDEIEQALDLCTAFADRVNREPCDADECAEPLVRSIVITCCELPN